MTQAIRLIALFFFVLGLVTSVPSDQAMAQLSAEAQGAAKLIAPNMGQNPKARFLENVNRKSPRAAIASFVAAMTALPDPNYDQAYECMEFTSVASVTKATKQRLANDLLRIIGHVGRSHSSGEYFLLPGGRSIDGRVLGVFPSPEKRGGFGSCHVDSGLSS